MQRRDVLKSIFIGPCLALLTAGGLATIVDSGGGGSSRLPLGAIRFLNELVCGGRAFTARLTIAGRALYSSSRSWSGCANFTPNTFRAEIYFVCGGRGYRGYANITISDLCSTAVRLTVRGGRLVLLYPVNCPGVCPVGDVEETESAETTETGFAEIIFDEDPDLESFEIAE